MARELTSFRATFNGYGVAVTLNTATVAAAKAKETEECIAMVSKKLMLKEQRQFQNEKRANHLYS